MGQRLEAVVVDLLHPDSLREKLEGLVEAINLELERYEWPKFDLDSLFDIVADFGTGIVIFVLSLVILSLMSRRISKKVKESPLNAVDRSLGFLFGLLRGALIVCIAYIGLGMFYPQDLPLIHI